MAAAGVRSSVSGCSTLTSRGPQGSLARGSLATSDRQISFIWQFPKIGGPFLVVLRIRALLFGDLYWDPWFLESPISVCRCIYVHRCNVDITDVCMHTHVVDLAVMIDCYCCNLLLLQLFSRNDITQLNARSNIQGQPPPELPPMRYWFRSIL